ncbi:polyprotein [Anhanga virus]|uniref:Envelopment polyprotein n=1 Tax=Anhanga virus TaxID=904722 RepID=A0A1S5SHU1_9VIRU|nr:polyprotein [Anhanga virus]API68877.1 polyprotein [Anhanga virus]
MNYFKIIILTSLAGLSESLIKVGSIHSGGSSKVCLSNRTPAETVLSYWESQFSQLPQGQYLCQVGSERKEEMDSRKIRRLVKEVGESITAIFFQCQYKENEGYGINVMFDGIDNTGEGTYIADCDDGRKKISDVRLTPLISRSQGTGDDEVTEPDISRNRVRGDLRALQEKVNRMHAEHAKQTLENEVLKEEMRKEGLLSSSRIQQLQERLDEAIDDIEDRKLERDKAIEDHKRTLNEAVQLRIEINHLHKLIEVEGNLKKEMQRELEEKHKQMINLKNAISASSQGKGLGSFVTMAIPIITTISLLGSASAMEQAFNPGKHVYNRIYNGKYQLETGDSNECQSINYGSKCQAFKHLTNVRKYPFFNSHYHMMSMLEAKSEGELSINNLCQLGQSNDEKKCWDEKHKIQFKCPNGFSSAHFIDKDGKLSGVKCQENMELSEDCSFCRKIKVGGNYLVEKSSIPLQDVVCQKNSVDYEGPKIIVKGYCSIGDTVYKQCKESLNTIENIPFVLFKNKGKIYVEKLTLRNTQHNSPDAFICYDHKGQVKGTVTDKQSERSLNSVKATECKQITTSKDKNCIGDPIFCSMYDCGVSSASVYCMLAPSGGTLEVLLMGSWLRPKCMGYEKIYVRKEVKSKVIHEETECTTCVSECKDDGIHIRSTGFKITVGVACAHGSCKSAHQSPTSEIVIPYPGYSEASGGDVGVHLSHADEKLSSKIRVHCPPKDPCSVNQCLLCSHSLINYQCHTVLSAFIVSLLVTTLLMIAIKIIWKMLRAFKLVPTYIKSPFMWLMFLMQWVSTSLSRKIKNYFISVNREIGWDIEAQEDDRPRRRIRPIPRYVYALSLLSIITVFTDACSDAIIASSKITSCRIDGSKTVCRINGIVTIKAGVIGGEACIILKGHQDGQRKHLSIRTLSSEMVCREGQSFWTSQYAPECFSSRRCRLMGECSGDNCLRWNQTKLSSEFSSIHDNEFMTENRCFEQCGGLGCSCFNVNPSCLFVHSKLIPARKEAVRVFSCTDWIHRLRLEVTDAQQRKERVVMGSLGSKFFNWGAMSLSLDAESITGTTALSFLQSGKGNFALHDEAISDIPREGFLGEVRCSSESAAITAHKSCIRAPGLIKYRPMLDQVECVSNLIDPFSVFLRGALPQTRNGMTFAASKDGDGVQAMNSGSIRAQLTINFDDYDIEFDQNINNCECSFINITGCYSCNEGAKVCFRIKSTVSGSIILRNSDDSLTIAFPVSTDTTDLCSIAHFGEPEVDEEMHYSCGSDERTIKIKGSLLSQNPFDDRNNTGGNSIIVNPSENGWSFWGWVKGLTSWMGGPLKTIVVILLYISCSLIVILLVITVAKNLLTNGLKTILSKTR